MDFLTGRFIYGHEKITVKQSFNKNEMKIVEYWGIIRYTRK